MNISLVSIWLDFAKGSVMDGFFWLYFVLMVIGLFCIRKYKFNVAVFVFMIVILILMYPQPYYYLYRFGGVNFRYFYQMLPFMVVLGAPAVLWLANKLQILAQKNERLSKYTIGKKSLAIILIFISAICLGFSLSQRSESEKNYIFEPIKIINEITDKTHVRPIYIVEEENDQDRVGFLIDAIQYNKISTKECNPEYILKMCEELEFLHRNIFFYVRMSDEKFRSLSKVNSTELKLLKEVVFKRHGRRTVFSLYQYCPPIKQV